jgi:superkiller protein 3
LLPAAPAVRANDLVPSEDITGGASVFVFRGSKKRPQERSASAKSFRPRGAVGGGGGRRARVRTQIAASRRRRSAKVRAAAIARQRERQRLAKIRQSNELTVRGHSLLERDHYETAATEFRSALELNPNNKEASAGLSSALTEKGIEVAGSELNESALTYLDEAVKYDENNAAAFAKIGEIHDARGRTAEAIANYEKALAIDPELSALYVPLGLAYMQAGNNAKAEVFLAKAEGDGIDASELRSIRLARLVEDAKYDEALAMIENAPPGQNDPATIEYQRGAVYDRMNKPGEAVAAYKRSVAANPSNSSAWYDMGVAYYNTGDYENALVAYQETVKIEPENTRAHANLASVYRQLMRYADANVHYRLAEPGFKNDPNHYSEWGYCLGKANEWDKAVVRLTTARQLSPDPLDLTNLGWGYYNAAQIDKANKNEEEAAKKLELGRTALQAAVEQNPDSQAAHLNLGATHNALGDFDAAVNAINRALSLQNDWVIAINQLGMAYRGSGDLSSALAQFQRVSALDGDNLFGLYNLGEVYYLTGNKREAKRVHDRLKRIDSNLAVRLDNVLSGKIVLDEAKRKIRNRIPLPRIPY